MRNDEFYQWLEIQPASIQNAGKRLVMKLDELILAGEEIDKWFSPFSKFGQNGTPGGLTIISGDLFTAVQHMPLFRQLAETGSFKVLGEKLRTNTLSVLKQSVILDEELLAFEQNLDHLSALFRLALHNCNPDLQLGRRKETTERRALYLDDAKPLILEELASRRSDAERKCAPIQAQLEKVRTEVDGLFDKYYRMNRTPSHHDDYDRAVKTMHDLEGALALAKRDVKELTLCMKAAKKTYRNRVLKIAA